MTVVDARHAAQLVTAKGKIFMYDAIECMVQEIGNNRETEYAFALINDYGQPGSLIPATTSTYLISEAIPSPMGAFLSAFPDNGAAQTMQAAKGGELYSWTELQQHLNGETHDLIADHLTTIKQNPSK